VLRRAALWRLLLVVLQPLIDCSSLSLYWTCFECLYWDCAHLSPHENLRETVSDRHRDTVRDSVTEALRYSMRQCGSHAQTSSPPNTHTQLLQHPATHTSTCLIDRAARATRSALALFALGLCGHFCLGLCHQSLIPRHRPRCRRRDRR
jgi:hypothetical protein